MTFDVFRVTHASQRFADGVDNWSGVLVNGALASMEQPAISGRSLTGAMWAHVIENLDQVRLDVIVFCPPHHVDQLVQVCQNPPGASRIRRVLRREKFRRDRLKRVDHGGQHPSTLIFGQFRTRDQVVFHDPTPVGCT